MRNRKKRLEAGHPWVYRSEIETVLGDPQTGDVVKIKNHQGHVLGQGFYHETSQIAVRVATYDPSEKVDAKWFRSRVSAAFAYRKRFLKDTSACRAVYGEADGLPGLIVDKYNDIAVVQILSSAMDKRRDWIALTLRDVLGVKGIYERSDAATRLREGLSEQVGCLWGTCDETVTIFENGLRFEVDIVRGQKTGHFFDQRDNRLAIAPLVRFASDEKPRPDQRFDPDEVPIKRAQGASSGRIGAQVLDCFSHTGGFGIHAAHFGAGKVIMVDQSDVAMQAARRNAALNDLDDHCEFVVANVFDLLREYEKAETLFDVVILDPPAFAKNRASIDNALRGYRDINLRALRIIKDNGFLVTASCSSHVTQEMWKETIAEAAMDAHKLLRLIEYRSAAKDHPQLIGMAENDYLKFAMYQVQTRSVKGTSSHTK